MRKRDCGVKIKLEPSGAQFLGIEFDFYGEKISFGASSTIGGQFGDFISAMYALYFEYDDGHNEWNQRESTANETDHRITAITTTVCWDSEGEEMIIEMTKYHEADRKKNILIKITTDYGKTFKEFLVNDKDLCYAAAKACTDVLKEYGIYGYRYSTEHDTFNLHQLLFVKAYALDCMEVRELLDADEEGDSKKTDFSKELELLLFDM